MGERVQTHPVTLIKYVLATGAIAAVWQTNSPTLAAAQIVENDPTYGYLAEGDADPILLQERWYVVDEELTAKTELTITATPNPFTGNGVAVCEVTVDPFVECTLLVNDEEAELTTGDDTLDLTSDAPGTFAISLVPMVTAWAEPIVVEAT